MILQLGGRVIDRSGLVEATEGSAAGLRRGHGQEIHVGQLVGGWIVYLHRESGPSKVAMVNRVGMRAPAFLSGCGKSGLAVLSGDDAWNRVQRSCVQDRIPMPDKGLLLSELAKARAQGYIVSRTLQEGWTSVGAAVVGAEGVVGGLSIAGPSNTFPWSRIHEVGEAVSGAAAAASRRLLGRRGRKETWRSASGYPVHSSQDGTDLPA
ncbi:IclR family transcriptional regulator C-terminal domain-containing protein [Rhodococcus sp. 1R11]|uniref:IclR family transcriptional regulator domain-containing protein n=1 Tax=Rhodococcus sp. 1R11 TaxID=2559614 RepID=UPI001FD71AF9|nr:IclR family transcriptional regulator C-terminal domain-containing protein [Rhodococcus sp. 1R11]